MSFREELVIEKKKTRIKMAAGIGVIIILGGLYIFLAQSGSLETICECEALHQDIVSLGIFGPLAIIGLMTLAVVASPIPSAPIALAAGMGYGNLWGTVYVVIGASAGAIIAFFISRSLGYEAMQKRFGASLNVGLLGSQNALTGLVMAMRLIPFISFDIVSYAAGLTPLKPWRFALATLIGVTPVSFALAYFGGELATADFYRIELIVLAAGLVTLIPVAIALYRRRKHNNHIT